MKTEQVEDGWELTKICKEDREQIWRYRTTGRSWLWRYGDREQMKDSHKDIKIANNWQEDLQRHEDTQNGWKIAMLYYTVWRKTAHSL